MRTVRLSTLLLVAFLFAMAPVSLRAQEPYSAAPAAGSQAPSAEPAAASMQASAQTSSGLPQRAAPPRTLREYTHVFAAFAIAWILLFGYVVSLGRRWARVEQELAARS